MFKIIVCLLCLNNALSKEQEQGLKMLSRAKLSKMMISPLAPSIQMLSEAKLRCCCYASLQPHIQSFSIPTNFIIFPTNLPTNMAILATIAMISGTEIHLFQPTYFVLILSLHILWTPPSVINVTNILCTAGLQCILWDPGIPWKDCVGWEGDSSPSYN